MKHSYFVLFLVAGAGLLALIVGITTVILRPDSAPIQVTPTEIIDEPVAVVPSVIETVIGTSVENRPIYSYTFGTGERHISFVGGMHGGYEWNSVLLAEEFIAYLKNNPSFIPAGIKISVIPNLNPDSVFTALGTTTGFTAEEALTAAPTPVAAGRFNANEVDLNRNFDCEWAPESTWRGQPVSAGTSAFSEPEARALRDFVLATSPMAVVFWHSVANNVYASECEEGILPDTLALMQAYATAANYGAVPVFDAYPITGDAEGWLASIGIPAITVELEGRNTSEWTRNLEGITATIEYFTPPIE